MCEIELDRLFRNEPEQAADPIASVLWNEPHHVVFQRRRALLLPPRQRGRDDLFDIAAEDPMELLAIHQITVSQHVGEKTASLISDIDLIADITRGSCDRWIVLRVACGERRGTEDHRPRRSPEADDVHGSACDAGERGVRRTRE